MRLEVIGTQIDCICWPNGSENISHPADQHTDEADNTAREVTRVSLLDRERSFRKEPEGQRCMNFVKGQKGNLDQKIRLYLT